MITFLLFLIRRIKRWRLSWLLLFLVLALACQEKMIIEHIPSEQRFLLARDTYYFLLGLGGVTLLLLGFVFWREVVKDIWSRIRDK